MNDEPPPWQSKPRFSGKFGCLLFGVGLPLLALLLLVAIYTIWTARANRRAARALAAIHEAGEPVDASELNAFYALPEGADDVTRLWLIPMRAFDGPDYEKACEPLPIVGWSEDEQRIPPPGEPWKDLEAVEAFLAKYAREMAAAHEAAERGGAARYPVDLSQGPDALFDHVRQTHAVARMLVLEAQVRAHRGDWPGAIRSIRNIHRLAGSLARAPCLLSQCLRYGIDSVARDTLQDLLETEHVPAEELAPLQELLQSIDYAEGLERALIGERAMGVSLLQEPELMGEEAPTGLMRLIPRGDDVAMYVDLMNGAIAGARQKADEKLQFVRDMNEEIKNVLESPGPIERLRYTLTPLLFVPAGAVASSEARATAANRAAAAVIAAERFRLEHGRLPKDLEELVPEFLAEVPADPFTGEPMKMKIEGDKMTVYSVGENQIDEQGQGDRLTGGPGDSDDVAFPQPPAPDEEE